MCKGVYNLGLSAITRNQLFHEAGNRTYGDTQALTIKQY